jgi:hypothetical protein
MEQADCYIGQGAALPTVDVGELKGSPTDRPGFTILSQSE